VFSQRTKLDENVSSTLSSPSVVICSTRVVCELVLNFYRTYLVDPALKVSTLTLEELQFGHVTLIP
jgi:hypothetical protein